MHMTCLCNIAVPGPGYQRIRSDAVVACKAGSAKAGANEGKCKTCPGRSYAPRPRQAMCLNCPGGKRVNAKHTACISYPAGSQPGRDNRRIPCPQGGRWSHVSVIKDDISSLCGPPIICTLKLTAAIASSVGTICKSLLTHHHG